MKIHWTDILLVALLAALLWLGLLLQPPPPLPKLTFEPVLIQWGCQPSYMLGRIWLRPGPYLAVATGGRCGPGMTLGEVYLLPGRAVWKLAE